MIGSQYQVQEGMAGLSALSYSLNGGGKIEWWNQGRGLQ